MAETWIDNLPHFMTTEAGRSAAQKAIAERDELLLKLETSQVALKGAEERAKMLLDAKSHWAERARTAESRLGTVDFAVRDWKTGVCSATDALARIVSNSGVENALCGQCERPVSVDATSCPYCKIEFVVERPAQ